MKASATKIRTNDTVVVISGKEKGKHGRVLRVNPDDNRVVVEKVNFIKRHRKPSQKQRKGGIIEVEGPLELSKVQVLCKKCDRPTRIGQVVLEDGKKQRFCRRCKETL
jgi:large subunit ribosomal protein L24